MVTMKVVPVKMHSKFAVFWTGRLLSSATLIYNKQAVNVTIKQTVQIVLVIVAFEERNLFSV
jgi:hypothetical protein